MEKYFCLIDLLAWDFLLFFKAKRPGWPNCVFLVLDNCSCGTTGHTFCMHLPWFTCHFVVYVIMSTGHTFFFSNARLQITSRLSMLGLGKFEDVWLVRKFFSGAHEREQNAYKRLVLVCGVSLDLTRRIRQEPVAMAKALQNDDSATLTVRRVCAGQEHGLVTHGACGQSWRTAWHMCRQGDRPESFHRVCMTEHKMCTNPCLWDDLDPTRLNGRKSIAMAGALQRVDKKNWFKTKT